MFSDSLTLDLSCLESLATATLQSLMTLSTIEFKSSVGSVKLAAGAAGGGSLIALMGLLFALHRRRRHSQIDEQDSVSQELSMPSGTISVFQGTKLDETLGNPLWGSGKDDDELFNEDCNERLDN
jgi:uncharacterized protein (TIGR03382 family)